MSNNDNDNDNGESYEKPAYLPPPPVAHEDAPSSPFSMGVPSSNTYTIILVILVILLVLGINVVYFSENVLSFVWNFIKDGLGALGYTVGTGIDLTAQATKDAAKTGIDIVGDAVSDAGILMKQETAQRADDARYNIDNTIDVARAIVAPGLAPEPTDGDSPIQNSISVGKQNWCLVGESAGTRSCAAVGQRDKCMSGQIFPDRHSCINPNLTPNV